MDIDEQCKHSQELSSNRWESIRNGVQTVGGRVCCLGQGKPSVFYSMHILPVLFLLSVAETSRVFVRSYAQFGLGGIVDKIVTGITDAVFAIVELIVGAFADAVGDEIAAGLMDVVLYTPLPEDAAGRPAIVSQPVNGPWPRIWDLFWGRFFVGAIFLGIIVYVIANAVSTIPFFPPKVREQFKGGIWRLLFSLCLVWPVMITSLYLFDVLIQIVAPSPDRLAVWIGGIITASFAAMAVSGPAAFIWGILGMIQLSLILIVLTLYIGRIIFLGFGVLTSPLTVAGLTLRIPVVRGISRKVLSYWLKLGIAPVFAAGLFHFATLMMTEPDGSGGWEFASSWGPGGVGIFFDIGVGMLLPFIGLGSYYIALSASLPSGVNRMRMRRAMQGSGPGEGDATAADAVLGGKKAAANRTPDSVLTSRGYSSSETLDAMNNQEVKEFRESNAYNPRDFMKSRVESGGYSDTESAEELIHKRREQGSTIRNGFLDRGGDLDDKDINTLQQMSDSEVEEFANSDFQQPTAWVDAKVDSTTDAQEEYHSMDDRQEWLDERSDEISQNELEDVYEQSANGEEHKQDDHELWKRMNPNEKREFAQQYQKGETNRPIEHMKGKIHNGNDPHYEGVSSVTTLLRDRNEEHGADRWGSLRSWQNQASSSGQDKPAEQSEWGAGQTGQSGQGEQGGQSSWEMGQTGQSGGVSSSSSQSGGDTNQDEQSTTGDPTDPEEWFGKSSEGGASNSGERAEDRSVTEVVQRQQSYQSVDDMEVTFDGMPTIQDLRQMKTRDIDNEAEETVEHMTARDIVDDDLGGQEVSESAENEPGEIGIDTAFDVLERNESSQDETTSTDSNETRAGRNDAYRPQTGGEATTPNPESATSESGSDPLEGEIQDLAQSIDELSVDMETVSAGDKEQANELWNVMDADQRTQYQNHLEANGPETSLSIEAFVRQEIVNEESTGMDEFLQGGQDQGGESLNWG